MGEPTEQFENLMSNMENQIADRVRALRSAIIEMDRGIENLKAMIENAEITDRRDRMRALTGVQEVFDDTNMEETQSEEPFVLPEGLKFTANNIYEGTSEEDNNPSPLREPKSSKPSQHSSVLRQPSKDASNEESGENLSTIMPAGVNQSFQGSSAPLLCTSLIEYYLDSSNF